MNIGGLAVYALTRWRIFRRDPHHARPAEIRSPGWGVHAFGACLDGCPWCELEKTQDA